MKHNKKEYLSMKNIAMLTLIATVIGLFIKTSDKFSQEQLDQFTNSTNKAVIQNKTQPKILNNKPESNIQRQQPITLRNQNAKLITSADANISIIFNNVMGQNFAKLTISPFGKRPVSLPIYNSGQYIEFSSNTGDYIANVLSIDFVNKNVMVSITEVKL